MFLKLVLAACLLGTTVGFGAQAPATESDEEKMRRFLDLSWVGNAMEDAWEDTVDFVEQRFDDVKNVMEQIGDFTEDVYQGAKGFLEDVSDAGKAWQNCVSPFQQLIPGHAASICFRDDYDSRECTQCIQKLAPDISSQLSGEAGKTYTYDMLNFKLGTGYTEGWCGAHPDTMDMSNFPGGWMPDGSGGYTGCEESHGFPGTTQTSIQSHAQVKEELKTVPQRQWEKSIWRGNELGFVISNEIFWPASLNPRGVLLGVTPEQHVITRPILEDLYTIDHQSAAGKQLLSEMKVRAKQFMDDRDTMRVQTDIKIWTHEELWRLTFPGVANPINVEEFVGVQGKLTAFSTVLQLTPDWMTKIIAGSTIDKLQEYFNKYVELTEEVYADKYDLHNKDCSPSTNCVHQVAGALLDTMLAAGGLSVPGGISTGLWVLHADFNMYGDTFPNARLDNDDPLPFFYESIRFFGPVVGFPFWTTPPDRATNEEGSQIANGQRRVLNVALSGKDPNVWGEDAHKFRVRDINDYYDNFLGFADTAIDNSVQNGAMNRVCPGKGLSLVMAEAWFSQWNFFDWIAPYGVDIEYTEAAPFIDEFELVKPQNRDTWEAIKDDVIASWSKLFTWGDDKFDQFSRGLSALNSFEVIHWRYPGPKDVLPPMAFAEDIPKIPMGLADWVKVPETTEEWGVKEDVTETADYNKFFNSAYAKGLSFPNKADDCGEWSDETKRDNKEERVVKELLFSGLSQRRVLTPWGPGDGKYTDQGFSDLVFGGMAQHKVTGVGVGPNAAAQLQHAEGAKYVIDLAAAEGLDHKEGFGKLGGMSFFNADQSLSHIYYLGKKHTPASQKVEYREDREGLPSDSDYDNNENECRAAHGQWHAAEQRTWKNWFPRGSRCDNEDKWRTCESRGATYFHEGGYCARVTHEQFSWAYVKMAHLGTISAVVTVIDHLYGLHLSVANAIVTANTEQLNVNHKLRRLLHPFSYRTAAINNKAAHGLVNEQGLIHRSAPLTVTGLKTLFQHARSSAGGITWLPIPERHAAQQLDIPDLPLHVDGQDFYGVVRKYVAEYINTWFPNDSCYADADVRAWHTAVNSIAPNNDLPTVFDCDHLTDLVSTFIYYVTGGHNHVGSIVAEMEDPCHMPWGFRPHADCSTPRTAFSQLLTFALTSLEMPKLIGDYTHLFQDDQSKAMWTSFQDDLVEFGKRVDDNNKKRKRAFRSFDMDFVELSVAV